MYLYSTYVIYMVKFEGKSKTNYSSVNLPKEMLEEVKRIIESDKHLGFTSAQEFVKESVRNSIVKYGGIYDQKE